MSFKFNSSTFEDNSFNEQIRDRLTRALNPGKLETAETGGSQDGSDSQQGSKKLDILKSGITVRQVNFRTVPQLSLIHI